jgi:hypothetical protein
VKFELLHNYGARRMRNYDPQPFLLDDGLMSIEDVVEEDGLGVETSPDAWAPRDVLATTSKQDIEGWPRRPRRFIDGRDVGRTIAWLRSHEGFPVPVYLSQIGAVEMSNIGGCLRREYETVERVVTLMADLFPWREVEDFADGLQENGFRLLPCREPKPTKEGSSQGYSYDFERMRKTTQNRSNNEMGRLEKKALARRCEVPTIVDGRLEPRAGAFDDAEHFVVGLIKQHSQNYLHPQGWRVFYELKPGERTPAFLLRNTSPEAISWYLRIAGGNGEMPNWGVVRLEIPAKLFQVKLSGDWHQLDLLSRLIYEYRCTDESYGRAPVSIYPIQRAEESLGAILIPTETFIQRFYRLTDI